MTDRTDDIDAPADAGVLDAEGLGPEVLADDGGDSADAGTEADGESAGADEVEALRAELDERTNDLQRVSAEFANFRRRSQREWEAARDNGRAAVIGELLGLVDDTDRAEQHGDLAEGTPLRAFSDKLRQILAAQQVEAFGETGDGFDPDIHEAVQDVSTGDDKALGAVLRKGYRMGERVLRTAMVVIDDAPEGTGSDDADAAES